MSKKRRLQNTKNFRIVTIVVPLSSFFPKIGKVIPTTMFFPVDIKLYCCYIRQKFTDLTRKGHILSKYSFLLAVLLSGVAFGVHAAEDNSDWLESYNRAVFNFNYQLDKYTLKPIAKGYRAVTTPDVRNRVTSFINNMREPVTAVNHTLQGSIKDSFVSVGRFLINSTLGLGGTFDVAEGWGLKRNSTGFDETLATYCVPDGPFFVVPLLGPSTPRSLVAYAGDAAANPMYWGPLQDKNYADKISYGYAAVVVVNTRERSLDLLDDLEKNSVDFYTTVRSAYMQNRQTLRQLCRSNKDNNKASYDFDFEIEDEDEF